MITPPSRPVFGGYARSPKQHDASLVRRLKTDPVALSASRQQLVGAGLIAYDKPFYQVLSLDPVQALRSGPMSVGDLLRRALGGQP